MRIESDPPGAEVVVDFLSVGKTPVEIPFTHYGTRRVELRMDGRETFRQDVPVRPPWYEWFPFELASEFLVPWTIRDQRTVSFALEPASCDEAALRKRAEEARQFQWKH